MKRRQFFATPLTGLLAGGQALHAETSRAGFEPWGPPSAPSFETIGRRLHEWQSVHGDWMRLETIGKSVQGRPLYRVWLTDPNSESDNKERVLMTALHSGQEHSGATSVLTVLEWLLTRSPEAREILKRQQIVFLPVVNPDMYENPNAPGGLANVLHQDPYTGWNLDGPLDPARCPEAVAVQQTIDTLQAEVHTDLHGNSLPFPGVYQLESSGRAYSNVSLRPYHHDVMRQMDAAAEAAGFPSDRAEEDAERIFGGSSLGMIPEKVWAGVVDSPRGGSAPSRPRIYAALYGYNRYHTMVLASENAWEASALVRQRRLLQIGNEIWPGELYPGYPVQVITKTVNDALIVAYGSNAEERRRSRVELWNKQRQLVHGSNRPSAVGRLIYACATTPAAANRWLSKASLVDFAAKMRDHPKMHADRIGQLCQGFPTGAGQWGPTSNMSLSGDATNTTDVAPLEHGISIRLRLPFPKARGLDLWMNGEPLPNSEGDGAIQWVARGFTYIQVNIPPERSRHEDLFVITCSYDPGEFRSTGLRW